MVRVCANGPGDLGSISDWVIPKTQKMILDAALLNTQHKGVKWSNPGKGVVAIEKGDFESPSTLVANFTYLWRVKLSNRGKGVGPFPTPQCSSYWKRSLRIALNYNCRLYFYFILTQIRNIIQTNIVFIQSVFN